MQQYLVDRAGGDPSRGSPQGFRIYSHTTSDKPGTGPEHGQWFGSLFYGPGFRDQLQWRSGDERVWTFHSLDSCHYRITLGQTQINTCWGPSTQESPTRPGTLGPPVDSASNGLNPGRSQEDTDDSSFGGRAGAFASEPFHKSASVTGTGWFQYWLQLASFAVDNGAELIGDLCTDEAQDAILPKPEVEGDIEDAVQVLRQAPSALSRVRQGVVLAAHITADQPISEGPVPEEQEAGCLGKLLPGATKGQRQTLSLSWLILVTELCVLMSRDTDLQLISSSNLEGASAHTEIGEISISPFASAPGNWLGYNIPFPAYCLSPHNVPSHVIIVVDVHRQWLRPVMQAAQHCTSFEEAVVSRWNELQRDPAVTRIWTYTCENPVEVPYVAVPDPALMYHQVGSNGRGIPAAGDFVWTQPRVVQGCAHILHIPPRSHPPYVFWLLHFRARGHVVASAEHVFDWSYIGALAAEAFGETWFSQGSFGIVHQGRVLSYGENIGIPPHGTVLHLTRTSLQPRTSQSIWDTPTDASCVVPFDYDICRGQRGGGPVYPVMPANPADTQPSGSAQAHRPQERPDEPSIGRLLNRQIIDIGNDMQVLITRLETAGVLPTPEVAPWVTQSPEEAEPSAQSGSYASRHVNPFPRLVQCSLWWIASALHAGKVHLGYASASCLIWQLPPVYGQDHDHDDSSEEAGPSEPSSPAELGDISAPTPLTSLLDVAGSTPVVRPSSDPLASTSVPGQEVSTPARPTPADCDVATAQHRFTCAIHGVQLLPAVTGPFVPAGVPVVMHNPFTGRPQCRLWTTAQHSPRVLLNTLSDYAQRRGWQRVCAVHPQPDNLAVHLIPSAANADLAAVILQAEGNLHPRCVQRTLPQGGTGAVTINGRAGRVIAPYSARSVDWPASLRDGDCLNVNFGPYGPPPPQPVHDAAHRQSPITVLGAGLLLSSRWGFLFGAPFLLAAAMDSSPPRAEDTKPIYRISAYPWRLPHPDRTAEDVCDRKQCRYTVLCPWTGPQGVFSVTPNTPISEVWRHYGSILPGWPDQQFTPTWPGLRHDRITVIPIPPSPSLACVVVRQLYHARAILLHAEITLDHLCRVIQYHTPWRPVEILLPPAVLAARSHHERQALRLRTGDVLDVLEASQHRQTIGVNNPDLIRGYANWNHGIGILCTTLVRLWDTAWRRPIITWLSPGAEWIPSQLSFSGEFQNSYPGRWVPIAWSPSRILQFMRASDSATQANVLVEQDDRTFATTTDITSSGTAIAQALQVHREAVTVIGAHITDPDHLCVLRDGDIIRATSPRAPAVPIYGWPDDEAGILLALLLQFTPARAVRLTSMKLFSMLPRYAWIILFCAHFTDGVKARGGLATLATILVFVPGCIRLRVPPSLRVAEHSPDAAIILRDGREYREAR
ncbi:unnamed protein product [Symbiodinium necroappetens]|uniref:Uncharacterized protein n=1 Tax=Symbiodinium necroappetens TaxID=1628268 RepID=A0A813BK50_9DINO|nr:unnamed protein product [Symbiodinium necroappetens]